MPISGYRRSGGERRRTARVIMSVPLRIDGETVSGEKFTVNTTTHTISQHGCLFLLEQDVVLDQAVVLMHEYTRQSIQCRVVSTRRHRDGKKYVGVEFIPANPNFWRMSFSKPGARSLKRF
jgi:c-di-GMP-binding flagellar brake protein YcgR